MVDVTVLGAAGATVTIPFTSAANAAAAQAALGTISDLVQKSVLTQYQYPGSGAVPAPTLMGGVVVSGSDPVNLGFLPGGEYSVINTATNGGPGAPGTTMIGAYNPMTVASGTGGIVFLNASSNAQVYLAGGTNLLAEGLASTSANVNVDGGDTHMQATMGATTINAWNDAQIQVEGGATGSAVVYAHGDNLVAVLGANDGNAVSVFGVPDIYTDPLPGGGGGDGYPGYGGNLSVLGAAGTDIYVDPGADDVTLSGLGADVTLVGGSGDATVFKSHGMIDGGGGVNYLETDSLAGATTLMSAGYDDTLIGNAAGNTYTFTGAEGVIADFSGADAGGGATYNTDGGGVATVYGSLGAHNTFNLGDGSVYAVAQHGNDGAQGNIFTDAYAGANQITIDQFFVTADQFSLTDSNNGGATVTSIQYYADAGSSAFGAVGTQAILSDGTRIDFIGANVNQSSFT